VSLLVPHDTVNIVIIAEINILVIFKNVSSCVL